MQNDRKTLIQAGAVLAAVILLISGYVVYTTMNSSNTGEDKPSLGTYELSFPKDEGSHGDVSENWMLVMNLTTYDGKSFIFYTTWSSTSIKPDETNIIFSVSDLSNATGSPYYSTTYTMKSFSYSEGNLNLRASEGYNTFRLKALDNMTSNYSLSINSNADSDYSIEARLTSRKAPVPFTQNREGTLVFGSIYLENGTLFGYVQSSFDVVSDFRINGEAFSAEGKAMLLHNWGGVWSSIFELLYLNNEENEIFALRYYTPGGESVNLEQIYIIRDFDYVIYSTFKGHTIGALVDGKNYTDLHGNTYVFYPTSYVLDPSDPNMHRAYAKNWTMYESYESIDVEVHAYMKYQFIKTPPMYAGAIFDDSEAGFMGWGFTLSSKKYMSNPQVVNVKLQKERNETSFDVTIEAQTSNSIPMKYAILEYNISGFNSSVSMEWNEEDRVWVAHIPSLPQGTTITYRVVAEDLADNRAYGEWKTESI